MFSEADRRVSQRQAVILDATLLKGATVKSLSALRRAVKFQFTSCTVLHRTALLKDVCMQGQRVQRKYRMDDGKSI
jgi:hypothetical protein